jgi:lipid-A-disaccharide synthase
MSEKLIRQVGAKRVLIIAGETSGDLHGANLVQAVKKIAPGVRFYGIGGDRLQDAGVELLFHNSQLAVVGIVEVLAKLHSIIRALDRVKQLLANENLDLAILIDFPDFNLHVATHLKRRGIPILYYISPQIWAWREWRIHKIKRLVDKMVVILPFEADFYDERGVEATFVGHPLLDVVRPPQDPSAFLHRLGIDRKQRIVSLFPGSRDAEVRRLLPIMVEAAQLMAHRLSGLHFLVSVAPDMNGQKIGELVRRFDLPAEIIEGNPYDAMAVSELLLVASGTVTLEATILNIPMVIVYKVSPLTSWIGRLMAKAEHIGLVNLVAGRTVAPELIQGRASPQRLADEALSLLTNQRNRSAMQSDLTAVKQKLGAPGASERAARLALHMMTRT